MVDHVTHRVRGQFKERTADIKSMIITWTQENKNSHWSEGLRFVQFQKNRSYHRTIEQSPYKALFGSDPKVGLSSSAIPKELLDTLETEEDFLKNGFLAPFLLSTFHQQRYPEFQRWFQANDIINTRIHASVTLKFYLKNGFNKNEYFF